MKGKVVLAVFLMAMAASPVFPISVGDLDINLGMLFIGNAPGGSGPSPLAISPAIGVSLPIGITDLFFIEPSLDFAATYYEYAGGRAVLASMESGSGFFTILPLLSIQAGLKWSVLPVLQLGGALGADFLFRFPFEFQNNSAQDIADMGSAMAYLYSDLRFLYPETRVFMRWKVYENLTLVVSLRVLYPLFHIWDGESLPFYDQLLFSGTIGLAFSLIPAAAGSTEAPAQ
jgi:hypothetical protein